MIRQELREKVLEYSITGSRNEVAEEYPKNIYSKFPHFPAIDEDNTVSSRFCTFE